MTPLQARGLASPRNAAGPRVSIGQGRLRGSGAEVCVLQFQSTSSSPSCYGSRNADGEPSLTLICSFASFSLREVPASNLPEFQSRPNPENHLG
eukprot:5711928-Pyramimonas_sp.AAC.1